MGLALEFITGRATAPGAVLTALTMATGDTLTIRNTNPGVDIRLLDVWAFNNATGVFRVRSPRMHDNVQGFRTRVTALIADDLVPPGAYQVLYPQDALIAEISGSAVGGNIEQGGLLIWYRDVPGLAARLGAWSDVMQYAVNMLTVEVAIASGAAGGYSGGVAFNSTFDFLKANTDYAIIGAEVDAACLAVTLKGPDTGNVRVAIPGILTGRWRTVDFFKRLSQNLGLPTIPIISSANKAGTTIEVVQNQGAAAVNSVWHLLELKPGIKTA